MSNCPSVVQVAINQPQKLIIFPGMMAAQLNSLIMSTFGINATTPAQLLAQGHSSGGSVIFTTGQYFMEASVYVPANVSLIFEPGAILYSHIPGGAALNNAAYDHGYIFCINGMYNSGASKMDWVWPYTGLLGARVQGLTWDCSNDISATTLPTPVFLGSPHRVIDTRANYPHGIIYAVQEYMDSFVVENLMVYQGEVVSSFQQIIGPYLGDNLLLKNIDTANTTLNLNRGVVINGVINSIFTLNGCSGVVVEGVHGELDNCQFNFNDTDYSFDGGYFYRSTISPIINGGTTSRNGSLKNIMFVDYIAAIPLTYLTGRAPDIQIRAGITLNLDNVRSTTLSPGNNGVTTYQGVVISDTSGNIAPLKQVNDYAYMYNTRCTIIGTITSSGASYYTVVDGRNSVDCGSGYFYGDTLLTNTNTASSLASGTYHYNMALLFDKQRMLGVSAANGDQAVVMTADVGLFYSGTMLKSTTVPGSGILRVYRGTAANSYGYYADIHMSGEATQIIDDGVTIAGTPWLTRAVSGVDAMSDIQGLELSFVNAAGTNNGVNQNIATIIAGYLPGGSAFTIGDTVKLPVTTTNTQTNYVWNGSAWEVTGINTTAASAVTVPASGVAIPAATQKGMYLVSGGTITGIGITRGGVATNTTVSLTGAIIPVNPGDTVALTYTTAPTAIEFMPL